MATRGRKKLTNKERENIELSKQTITPEEYMAKPRRYFNEDKTNKIDDLEIIKTQKYVPLPVVMVFKTSNRSNAKIKIKVWTTYNIDYILSAPNIPGLPEKAEILDLGVGEKLIERYKKQYKIT